MAITGRRPLRVVRLRFEESSKMMLLVSPYVWRPRKKWLQQSSLALALLAFTASLGCCPSPQMTEFPARYDNQAPEQIVHVPIILVGVVLTHTQVGDFHPSRIEGNAPIRGFRCRIRVENVLQGNVSQGEVDIFYFIGTDSLTGGTSILNLPAGVRRIFFLQRDGGKLRTIYDNWETTVEKVYSGAHPSFKRNPNRPVTEAIVDLLLTRGEGATDKDMMEAVYWVGGRRGMFGEETVIKKLQQIAREETLPVREEACYFLADRKLPCEGIVGKEHIYGQQ
jgi:hypothetical protein